MNDPNGLFKASNGTYHLYYQCACFLVLEKAQASSSS